MGLIQNGRSLNSGTLGVSLGIRPVHVAVDLHGLALYRDILSVAHSGCGISLVLCPDSSTALTDKLSSLCPAQLAEPEN